MQLEMIGRGRMAPPENVRAGAMTSVNSTVFLLDADNTPPDR